MQSHWINFRIYIPIYKFIFVQIVFNEHIDIKLWWINVWIKKSMALPEGDDYDKQCYDCDKYLIHVVYIHKIPNTIFCILHA